MQLSKASILMDSYATTISKIKNTLENNNQDLANATKCILKLEDELKASSITVPFSFKLYADIPEQDGCHYIEWKKIKNDWQLIERFESVNKKNEISSDEVLLCELPGEERVASISFLKDFLESFLENAKNNYEVRSTINHAGGAK